MHILRWIVGVALFLFLLSVALQNNDHVTLKYYSWWSVEAPLIFVVLITFAIGVALGLLAGALRSARLKRQLSRLRRERLLENPTPGPHGAVPSAPDRGPIDAI